MDEQDIKPLGQMKHAYILKILEESHWDFKKAGAILKVSESYLRRELGLQSPPPKTPR
jgi:hypothetical protein